MTKYDIRFRRGQFAKGRISRHKNYDGLLRKHQSARRRSTIWLLLILLILIMLAFLISTMYNEPSKKDQRSKPEKSEQSYKGPHSFYGIT
mgnify:CR=1 FL=1|jgi:flagellar basal body-associated protein FliL